MDGVPHEQVGLFALLHFEADELQQVTRIHKDVVVSFKDELHVGAEYVEPLEKVDLFQGQVEEGVHEVPLQDVPVYHVLVLDQLLEVTGVLSSRWGSQKKQRFDLLPIHRLLLTPGFTHSLPAVVLLNNGLDHHEEVHLSVRALLRVVNEHGEVPAVSVQDELVKSRVQAPEPVLGPQRRVLSAVENLRVPFRGSPVGNPRRVQIVLSFPLSE